MTAGGVGDGVGSDVVGAGVGGGVGDVVGSALVGVGVGDRVGSAVVGDGVGSEESWDLGVWRKTADAWSSEIVPSGSPPASSAAVALAGVSEGSSLSMMARTPETCGAAIDVPCFESEAVSEVIPAETMAEPGA